MFFFLPCQKGKIPHKSVQNFVPKKKNLKSLNPNLRLLVVALSYTLTGNHSFTYPTLETKGTLTDEVCARVGAGGSILARVTIAWRC